MLVIWPQFYYSGSMTTILKRVSNLRFLFSIFLIILFFFSFGQSVHADSSVEGAATMGVAKLVSTNQKNIKDGSVMSSSQDGAVLSTIPYDSQVLGVVSQDAAIQISSTDSTNSVPVIPDGTVYVLVSSKNGTIKKGDLITTSTIPGVAVRADKDGYVLGTALEDYDNPDPAKSDKIAVDLNLHYFNSKPTLLGSLTDIFKYAILPTKDSPSAIYKYIVAAAVVLASFILAFMTFGRTAAKGVEALGRNPSASRIIHLGIIFNVAIVVVIVLAGLTVAFLILRL
jgi:F0F1-type ATP synthase membrane subunit c/vacuolar-type H+-ATPase subunit K